MESKFLRKARDIVSLFIKEYDVNQDQAMLNLEKRLKSQRNKIKYIVVEMIDKRYPGLLND